MRRGKPLTRTTRLERRTPLRARGKSRFPKRRSAEYRAWIREQACILSWVNPREIRVHTCEGPIECAHVKSRGAGGNDIGNCLPMCAKVHRAQHLIGIRSFERFYRLNLSALAEQLATDWPAASRWPGAEP